MSYYKISIIKEIILVTFLVFLFEGEPDLYDGLLELAHQWVYSTSLELIKP